MNNSQNSENLAALKELVAKQQNEIIKLKAIIDTLPGDIYWKDVNGVWLGITSTGSQSLKKMGFLWKPKEVIGKTDYDLFEKITADEYRKNDLEVMRTKTEIRHEETVILPSGEVLVQLSVKRPLFNENGDVIGIVGNTVDISYLKKIENDLRQAKEAAEAASRAKTMFLANMSHDIKTPISGIISMAEYLTHATENADLRKRADTIVHSGLQLLELMIEIIEISRLEMKETALIKSQFRLKKLVDDIVALTKPAISNKSFKLYVHYDTKIPPYVIGDRWNLYRVILNLLSNAIKFTNKGSITIQLELIEQIKNNVTIKISIIDTGIGISKKNQAIVFEEFTRLTPSSEGVYKGAGLGLSIVKKFIEAMKGKIYVESEENKGSAFICVVPFEVPDLLEENMEVSKSDQSSSVSNAQQTLTPLEVLLVEDTLIAAIATKSNLEMLQCVVHHASTGKDAVEIFKNKKIDLVFMDLGLPDMDGRAVAAKIREIEKQHGGKMVPIIALSAHLDNEMIKTCLSAGITETLTKPLRMELAKKILDGVTEK